MKKAICYIFAILGVLTVNAQPKNIDSLKLLLQQNKKDTTTIIELFEIGKAYEQMKNDSALIYFQQALNYSQEIGFKQGEIQSRSSLADFLYLYKADYAAALNLYLLNIKTEEQENDTAFIFWDTRGVGFVYGKIGNYEKELEYINKLKSLINAGVTKDKVKSTLYNLALHNRLASVYTALNKPDSAKANIFQVYNYGIKNNELQSIALGGNTLGSIYKTEKNHDSAVYYYQASISAALKINRKDIYIECLIGLGELYWESKQIDSSFYYSIKAFDLSLEERNTDQTIHSATLLSQIYYVKKSPDSAYKYLKQSGFLKDSLFSAQKISSIENLSLQESLQQQQEEQTKKEAVKEYKSEIKVYSLVAGLLGLIVIIFFLYKNNRQRNIANRKIEKAYNELKSTQAQLIQSEKMASLGELTAGIAHEIQNPLNFVNNFSDVNKELLEELKDEADKGNIDEVKAIANDVIDNEEKINHHGKRADSIVRGMLQHSRQTKGMKEPTDINALCDEYLRLSYHGLRAKDKNFNADFKTDFDETIGKINIVPQDIGRVLLNLFNNAFYAVNDKKKLMANSYQPTAEVKTRRINDKVEITVSDNGNGVPQNIIDKIFQPFFTTKPTGQGTGLGLSLAYDIITKEHNGTIKVESKEGEGSKFIIQLNFA